MQAISTYSVSQKSWPILHNKLLYERGHDFLNKQY